MRRLAVTAKLRHFDVIQGPGQGLRHGVD